MLSLCGGVAYTELGARLHVGACGFWGVVLQRQQALTEKNEAERLAQEEAERIKREEVGQAGVGVGLLC